MGSFWIGYGHLALPGGGTVVTLPSGARFPAFGYWFVALAAITFLGTFATLCESLALTLVLGSLTAGAALLSVALLTGSAALEVVSGGC